MRFIKFFLILISVSMILATGCSDRAEPTVSTDEKINVLCTIFPQYDLASKIGGDMVNVELLLKMGSDSHNYEQTPADIIAVSECDLLITVGGINDIWLEKILPSVLNDTKKNIKAISLMDCVNVFEEDVIDGMQEEDDDEDEEIEYDEHVWTNPKNMIKIANSICQTLIELDSENEVYYTKNLRLVVWELENLDRELTAVTDNSDIKTLIFGDRFAFRYLTEEYGLDYFAAFPGCSTDTDASAGTIAFLIDKVRELDISVVYYLENGTKKIAEAICRETGTEALMLHSCHTVTQEEMNKGYVGLMQENIKNLQKGINK